MGLPEPFVEGHVLQLHHSLYGLRQSSKKAGGVSLNKDTSTGSIHMTQKGLID